VSSTLTVNINGSSIDVPVTVHGSTVTLDVDTSSTELTVADEIDTSVSSVSPQTILTPTSGKQLDTRGVFLYTDSTSGEVSAKFANSGSLLAKIYATKFFGVELPDVRFTGAVNESIIVSWTGLSNNSKIFYVIKYKEI